MEAKVSFSLRSTSKRKRLHNSTAGIAGGVPTGIVKVPVGAFLSAEDAAREAAVSAEQVSRPLKKALLLEDEQAKVKRLQVEGNTLAEAGHFRAAMGRWIEALAIDHRNSVMYELLAQAAMAVGDDFDAVQFGLKAITFAPSWGDAYHTLARCHLNFGELDLALENITMAQEILGANDELLADRHEIEELLDKQRQILERHDAEATGVVGDDKLQVISCMKHLSLRGQVD